MTMTRSRKTKLPGQPDTRAAAEAALPSLAGYWSEAEIDKWNEKLLADLDSASALAQTPHNKRYLQILRVAVWVRIESAMAKAWLGMAFQRIDALERQLKDAKSIRRKALDSRFSLEDLVVEQIDDRNIKLGLVRGEEEAVFTLKFPVLIGRGIWSADQDYEPGDVTTWGGTAWEAVEPAKGVKPNESSGGWRIFVKRGRDGKDVR